MNEFEDARILECGHTFCVQCLQRLKMEDYTIICPNCKKIHPNVLDVTDLVKNFSAMSDTSEKEVCPEHPQIPISHFCKNCKVPVCATCMLSIHRDASMHMILELSKAAEEKKENLRLSFSKLELNISLVNERIKKLEYFRIKFQKMKQTILQVNNSTPGTLILRSDELIKSTKELVTSYQFSSLTFQNIMNYFLPDFEKFLILLFLVSLGYFIKS